MSLNSGILWVVATPLGNPGDLSPRARETLAGADLVLAEDSRRTGILFAQCGIKAKALMSFHDHNEETRLASVLARLAQGETLALVSDAGTPLLSDPGFRLVRACRKQGVRVAPVPGPSAPAAALSAAGMAPVPHAFLGFAPRKKGEQEAFFRPWAALGCSLVFFDRKDRLAKTLAVAASVLGPREVCIAREMTKTYEEFIFFRLEDLAEQDLEGLLGEITVILGPPESPDRTPEAETLALAGAARAAGLKPKEAAKEVLSQVRGWTAKEIYQLMRKEGP